MSFYLPVGASFETRACTVKPANISDATLILKRLSIITVNWSSHVVFITAWVTHIIPVVDDITGLGEGKK